MGVRSEVFARFVGQAEGNPVFLPDLTLWYRWHRNRGTLPEKWQGLSMAQIARDMGMPVWEVVTPWRVTTPGVSVVLTEKDGERTLRVDAPSGSLFSCWKLGPDGDWWQTDYPVKSSDDLKAALEWIEARQYVLETTELQREADVAGDDRVLAVALPRRPYAELLNDLLGWSDGLLLLGEPAIGDILELLESKLQEIVKEIVDLPGDVILSPDNLDGQFVSPRTFARYFAKSYQATVDTLAARGKPLVVHAGGPVGRLLKPLADAGVSAVEGVCGPPQGDTTLPQAREAAGPDLTLWGGIPQDILLDAYPAAQFETAVQEIVDQARSDSRVILGVADKVPPEADLERLAWVHSIAVEVGRYRPWSISNVNKT